MNFYYGIVISIISFTLITGGSIFLFVLYQKRLLKKQEELYMLDAQYKKELISSSIQSAEEERMRIAKDIHDEIGSIFSSLSLSVNQIKQDDPLSKDQVDASKNLINTGIKSIRRISHAIVPFELELLGLQQTLDNHFESIASLSEIDIHFECEYQLESLSNNAALAIYRIMQELFSNCIKYSQASKVDVSIKQTLDKNSLHVLYLDNGVGVDLENQNLKKGIGLKNIESRVIALEGTVNFNSEPTKNFACELFIPLNKDNLK